MPDDGQHPTATFDRIRTALRTLTPDTASAPSRPVRLLTGEVAARYADGIRDVTPLARQSHEAVRAGRTEEAGTLLPEESPYPVPEGLLTHLGA
ncbi:hypothetical protein GT030_33500 [Streptomyces sp. SID1328]|uniref:DUF4291 domain-containing protein n=1 Tax=Streptomyces sp. SID1328 TaxID=2690250 RepID=UPI001369F501|nr:DUF4291 domain-containing protein [Streptomyces sp. SID1328]MYV43646.1 hypothetical protein [Streptomyces sp. SID1328]